MPELPEVETIVRQLRRQIIGKTIASVHVHWKRSIQGPAREFRLRVTGKAIAAISRRGKFIGFELHDKIFFTIHLRMTGKLVCKIASDERKHLRLSFFFDDGTALHFVDARKFGRVRLWPCKGQSCPGLGPEPLRSAVVLKALKSLRTLRPIKSVLLDQDVLAGIGNIYADEALHAAGIHPLAPAVRLSNAQRSSLSQTVPEVLKSAIRRNGTTLRDYRTVAGAKGDNEEHLQVYGRTGQPCFACGSLIEKIRIAGRSSHYCPDCQKARSVTSDE